MTSLYTYMLKVKHMMENLAESCLSQELSPLSQVYIEVNEISSSAQAGSDSSLSGT